MECAARHLFFSVLQRPYYYIYGFSGARVCSGLQEQGVIMSKSAVDGVVLLSLQNEDMKMVGASFELLEYSMVLPSVVLRVDLCLCSCFSWA